MLADLRRLTARMVIPDRRLRPQAVVAVIRRFAHLRAMPLQAEMAWPTAASRLTEDGTELRAQQAHGIARSAGSQDRRFPRAGTKNSLYVNGD
jgi:hypothetical protein